MRLPKKKRWIHKFETGLTAAMYLSPATYLEYSTPYPFNKSIKSPDVQIIKSNQGFGGNYFINYHFSKHIGLNWGFQIFSFSKSFVSRYNSGRDSTFFTTKNTCYHFPVNFLWDINPKNKVKCFLIAGIEPGWDVWNSHLDEGGTTPINSVDIKAEYCLLLLFDISAGIKIPIYRNFSYTLMLKYENTYKPVGVSNFGGTMVYNNTGFLSLNMGFCF